MTTLLTVVLVTAAIAGPVWLLLLWDERKARRRHPANWTDDGKALAEETEDYLRRRTR
jgi:hypothetical protein